MADPIIYGVLAQLRECARVALAGSSSGEPDRVCIYPGRIIADDCNCGMLALTALRAYRSRRFPTEEIAFLKCGDGILAADLQLVVLRCVPVPDDHGNPPTCAALDEAARVMHEDAELVRDAIQCCLAEMHTATGLQYIVRQQPFEGPQGDCAGSQLLITIGLGTGCGC